MRKNVLCIIAVILLTALSVGCASQVGVGPDPDKIVPGREVLIGNLQENGYAVETLSAIEGSDLTIDRVLARNGDRFIDIVYGASSEDAPAIFEAYRALYTDYYILARNGNYVYCVSDKSTFSTAGFTSTDNVGVQYIHE